MRKQSTVLVSTAILLVAVASSPACEDEPQAPPAQQPVSPLADLLQSSGITASGYIAASYYHSNGYNSFHQFDMEHDSFQLDQAAVTLAHQPKEGFGILIDVAAGEDMRILHAAEDGKANTFDLVQGFVQYASGPITVIAGKYVTLAGAEVIAPVTNTNFSRSLLFFAEPLTHTGIRVTYALEDTLGLIAGVNNGWNTTATSYGSKTGELGVAWIPNKTFSLTAQSYVGKIRDYDALRTLIDMVATYNVTSAFSFVVSYDWGKQQRAEGLSDLNWAGVAGYVNYALSDQWRVSLRAEYLNDKDGFVSGTAQKLKEATLTLGYDPVKSFELRLEARYDKSGQATFVRAPPVSPADAGSFADNQTEVALQGLFKF